MRMYQRTRLLGVATVVVAATMTTTGIGQITGGGTGVTIPCKPLGCTGVDTAPFIVPSGWGLIPDKRPLGMIQTWAGYYNDNPLGLTPAWYDNDVEDPNGTPTDVLDADGNAGSNGIPDAFDFLLRGLNRKFDDGIRRMILMLPAGSNQNSNMASSQWWTMTPWKRAGMVTYVKPWLEAKAAAGDPVSFGVYAGFRIKNPCELSMDNATVPDPYDQNSMCLFYQNVQPWIDLGAKEYWLDASGAYPATLDLIQRSPNYRDIIRFGGEAIPHDTAPSACDGNRTPDASAVEASPFVALFAFVESRFRNNKSVDPATTDLGLFLTGHTVCSQTTFWTFEDVKSYYDNGWSIYLHGDWIMDRRQLIKNDPSSIYFFDYSFNMPLEAIRRLYNFGVLTSVLDYDNDGLIEVDLTSDPDYDIFFTAWLANVGNPGGYLDGDANGSGTVDIYDLLDYEAARTDWLQNQVVQTVDLGPAWWE